MSSDFEFSRPALVALAAAVAAIAGLVAHGLLITNMVAAVVIWVLS